MNWTTATVGECLAKVTRPGKLQTKDYQAVGQFPIIDQGEGEIAGYTDQAEVVVQDPLPLVVFGDHTRRVKLAKEPFACGADGTQLLFPNRSDLDPTFFYYAVASIDLSNYFYARHFKFLKEQKFSFPDRPTQLRIVDILSAYDDLIENNRRRMALLEDAARHLYREWFIRLRFPGYEHTPFINGVPQGWTDCRVSDFGEVVTGKTPSTKEPDNYGGPIPFIKTPDMHGNVFVVATESSLTEKGANTQPRKFIPPNTLLISCIGTIGVVSITSRVAQFNQQINALVPTEEACRYYLFFALKDLKEAMEAIGGGATMGNVNKTKFEGLKVRKPRMTLLREFHQFCAPAFQQIHMLSLQNLKLRAARDLLLPRLMSGEVAV